MKPAHRILLIAAHYPPDRASGARRPWEVVGMLRRRGLAVTVLTFAPSSSETLGEHGETIIALKTPDAAYASERKYAGNTPSRDSTIRRFLRFARRLAPRLAMHWFSWRIYPDDFRDTVTSLAESASRLSFDLLYSSGPPMSMHLAACNVARAARAPWIAEFRDPWADPVTGKPVFAGSIVGRRETRDRALITRGPDATVGVSTGIGDWLTAQGSRRVYVSRNGIPDRLLSAHDTMAPSPHSIGYFGFFYHERSPEPFLDALARLLKDEDQFADVQVQLVGEVERFRDTSVREMLSSRGLLDHATLTPRIAHDDAVRMMRESGVLLLLAQKQPRQVPNKLYEYLGVGRPILAWVDDAGESAAILRDVGGHFLVTELSTPEEIVETVRAALGAAATWTPPRPDRLLAYTSERQLEVVVDLVHDLLRGTSSIPAVP